MSFTRTAQKLPVRNTACRALVVLLLVTVSTTVCADDAVTEWQNNPQLSAHLRLVDVQQQTEQDQTFQRFKFLSAVDAQKFRIRASVPDMLPIHEFEASTRVNSTHAGIQLVVRLVLPHQLDPETRSPLATWVRGTRSTSTAEWEELRVALTESVLKQQLVRVRADLAPLLVNTDDMYIDHIGLQSEASPGECIVDVEPVKYGPVVLRSVAGGSDEDEPLPEQEVASVRNRVYQKRGELFVDGRPTFMRVILVHGESLDQLNMTGGNAVWRNEFRSDERAQEIHDDGFVILATPPYTEFDPKDFRTPLAGLMPLHQTSALTDIFMLGTGVPPDKFPLCFGWASAVRSADRQRNRLLMAGMSAAEGLASRHIDMVGIDQRCLHQNVAIGQLRGRLLKRSGQSTKLTLPWCWVETESPADLTRWRSRLGLDPLVVEPEQITMQVMAALSGGSRAIAYWKTRPFGDGKLRSSEAGLAVALSNLHIDLFEPWLVQGQSQSYVAANTDTPKRPQQRGLEPSLLQSALTSPLVSVNPLEMEIPRKPDATLIRSRMGTLVLVVMWDDATQFVSGSLYADKVRLTVPARETASAAQINVFGVSGQRRKETAGGLAVEINGLDQFATVLVASNPAAFQDMQQRVQAVAGRAAELKYMIAQLKHHRVKKTCAEIDELAPHIPPSAARSLQNAGRALEKASTAVNNGQFSSAVRQSDHCLRLLRHVQNLYWKDAVRQQPTPTASPFTIAFSSMPEHWRMMQAIDEQNASQNLLPAETSSRPQELVEAGWLFPPEDDDLWMRYHDVSFDARNNSHWLRLAAHKRNDRRGSGELDPSTVVVAPAVEVTAGDFIEIQGRVRLGEQLKAEQQYPLMIFDQELGPRFAVRPALDTSWRTFRMYRQAAVTGPYRMSFALDGTADVHLDLEQLSIRRVGHHQWVEFDSDANPVQPVSRSRVQGAGHSFPSLDWESSLR